MQHLRNLALMASMLCFGLSPALAMSHKGGEGGEHGDHKGPPPPPPSLVDIIEDVLEGGDLSDNAETMLGHLLMTPEEREAAGEPDMGEEGMEAAKEEINKFFEGLLEDEDLPEDAQKYINMMLHHMEGEHMGGPCGGGPCGGGPCGGEHAGPCGGGPCGGGPCGGEHGEMGPPPMPPESMIAIIKEILEDDGSGLSETAATMLGHLILSPEERKAAGMPELGEEEMEAGKEEIAEIFEGLLEEEDLPEDAEKYINMMLQHMNGEHMGGEHMGGCGGGCGS